MKKRVALVTGGVGSIGTAIARRLYDDGVTVAVTHRPGKDPQAWLEREKPREFHPYPCDVADWQSCVSLGESIQASLGDVDVIVNNAGITRDASFKKMTLEMWQAVLSTNLDSVFNISKQFFAGMLERGYGRIINISSVNGQKGQFGQANYAAAKAGMHGFTKALAQEGARKGVTVNTVSPGYIETEMLLSIDQDIRDAIRAQIPINRYGQSEEVARIVSFLAAEEAGLITGANISANGGQHMF